MSQLNATVALMVFNRPGPTRRVFAAIAAARPTRLLVVADGPRADREGERQICDEVRKIVSAVDWPCKVETNFSRRILVAAGALFQGSTGCSRLSRKPSSSRTIVCRIQVSSHIARSCSNAIAIATRLASSAGSIRCSSLFLFPTATTSPRWFTFGAGPHGGAHGENTMHPWRRGQP